MTPPGRPYCRAVIGTDPLVVCYARIQFDRAGNGSCRAGHRWVPCSCTEPDCWGMSRG